MGFYAYYVHYVLIAGELRGDGRGVEFLSRPMDWTAGRLWTTRAREVSDCVRLRERWKILLVRQRGAWGGG